MHIFLFTQPAHPAARSKTTSSLASIFPRSIQGDRGDSDIFNAAERKLIINTFYCQESIIELQSAVNGSTSTPIPSQQPHRIPNKRAGCHFHFIFFLALLLLLLLLLFFIFFICLFLLQLPEKYSQKMQSVVDQQRKRQKFKCT